MDSIILQLKGLKGLYLVYDSNVEGWADTLAGELEIESCMSIDAGEDTKDIATVMDICRWLLATGADRDSTLVVMGGGVTTDMGAFAASIYKRGIGCILIPTTLLAMVDAAHGGKTGVNLDGYKNMVGTFAPPSYKTLIDSCFLSTLPRRELLCGAAEMLKTFIIEDGGHYEQAGQFFAKLNQKTSAEGTGPDAPVKDLDTVTLDALIKAAVAVKSGIVRRDRLERGERRGLNLGHTIAHAIEWYERSHGAARPLNHGEAVAIGIAYAARLSEQRGVAAAGLSQRIVSDLQRCGLPTELPYPVEDLREAILKDKKNAGGEPRWVLIRDIGDVII